MPSFLLILPPLLPILSGMALFFLPARTRARYRAEVLTVVLATTAITWLLALYPPEEAFTPLYFANNLTFSLRMDGAAATFALLSATLWPLATLYAFGYIPDDANARSFYAFYVMSFGATMGVAMGANLLTLYVFYEALTFVTLPLVMYGMSRESVHAARKYLYYALGGSAFAFIGMIFLIKYGGSTAFVAGGLLAGAPADRKDMLLVVYLMTFLGFGVKAAMVPVHAWLPSAAIAPTPVTALLHAVAVVKAGAFAILRVTYMSWGADFLAGTWAQAAALCVAAASIVYGSSLALKEKHLKRRLAYSTVANLSYVVYGALLLTAAGLTGALLHMLAHAAAKICLFFCAGAVTLWTGRQYVREMEGMGRRLPVLFGCFTLCALSLTGIPPFIGFASKWTLAMAGVAQGGWAAYAGVGALLLSALLTMMYTMTVAVPAFFPRDGALPPEAPNKGGAMTRVSVALCAAVVALSAFAGPLTEALSRVARSMMG